MDDAINSIHLVSKYTGMTFVDCLEMPCDTFQRLYRNAYVDRLCQYPEGIKQIKDYKRLHTTEPELDKLSKAFKIETKEGG